VAADLICGLNIYHVLKHFISLEMKSHLGSRYCPLNAGKDRNEAKRTKNLLYLSGLAAAEAVNTHYGGKKHFSPLTAIQK